MKTVQTKQEMYRMLQSGAFGNCLPQYFTVKEWKESPDSKRFDLWGIRSMVRNSFFLDNIGSTMVPLHCHRIGEGNFNISLMVDPICTVTAWIQVTRSKEFPFTTVNIMEYPPKGGNWTRMMPYHAKDYQGIRAVNLLKKHLNENSYDDLEILLEEYPDSVVELSALDICLGRDPHRNGIIWEVRNY